MAKSILCVLSHKLTSVQVAMFKKIHGKNVDIDRMGKRFDNKYELQYFHSLMQEFYDYIYYVLPKEFKKFLQELGMTFRVLTAKKISAAHTEVSVFEYDPEETMIKQKTYHKHTESKYYINRFFPKNKI